MDGMVPYELNDDERDYLRALEATGAKALASLIVGRSLSWSRVRAHRYPGFGELEREAAVRGRLRIAGVAQKALVECLSSKKERVRLKAAMYILDRIDADTGEARLYGAAAQLAGVDCGGFASQRVSPGIFHAKLPEMTSEQFMELARTARARQQPAIEARLVESRLVEGRPSNGTDGTIGPDGAAGPAGVVGSGCSGSSGSADGG